MDYSPRLAGFEVTAIRYSQGDFFFFALVEQVDALLDGGQSLVLAGILEFLSPALPLFDADAVVFDGDADAVATLGPKANLELLGISARAQAVQDGIFHKGLEQHSGDFGVVLVDVF